MSKRTFFGGLVAILVLWHVVDLVPTPTATALAPDAPDQQVLAPGETVGWTYRGYHIIPLARYEIKARVMHRESYYLDHAAAISPLDLALGWGRMSNPAVYDQLHIGQGWRWYTWHWYGAPPIPESEINTSSANTHLIPATDEVRDHLFWVRTGNVIKLSGYLVEADGEGTWHWRSSLTRDDSGDGSCEVMWVKEVETVGR